MECVVRIVIVARLIPKDMYVNDPGDTYNAHFNAGEPWRMFPQISLCSDKMLLNNTLFGLMT